jgi:hypothetical protein
VRVLRAAVRAASEAPGAHHHRRPAGRHCGAGAGARAGPR